MKSLMFITGLVCVFLNASGACAQELDTTAYGEFIGMSGGRYFKLALTEDGRAKWREETIEIYEYINFSGTFTVIEKNKIRLSLVGEGGHIDRVYVKGEKRYEELEYQPQYDSWVFHYAGYVRLNRK